MISKGKIHHVRYPFVRCKVDVFDGENVQTIDSWRPGINCEDSNYGGSREWAEGHGEMILEIVDTFKPGKYPERVFYLRRWKNPDGTVFGKTALRITTKSNFTRLIKGYRHDYDDESEA